MSRSTTFRIGITAYGVFALAVSALAINGAPRSRMTRDSDQMVAILFVLAAMVIASLLWAWIRDSRPAAFTALFSSIAATTCSFGVFLA